MERALEEGDSFKAQTMATELKKQLSDLEEEASADEVLAGIEAAQDSKEVLKWQAAIAKIRKKDPSKKADIQKAIDALKDIRTESSGTYAAGEADRLVGMLERRKRS